MNILVGYQIPYSQAKIDNTHLNRHKWRLAAEHYASRKNKYVKWYGKGI